MNWHSGRSILVLTAILVVVYVISGLTYVSTCPDLRVRCLLVNSSAQPGADARPGLRINMTRNLRSQGPTPAAGDLLLEVREQPIRNFLDLSQELIELHNADISTNGYLDDPAELLQSEKFGFPPLVEDSEGLRWVKVRYLPAGASRIETAWVLVQSMPLSELVFTFVWVILELAMFLLGGLAYWNRPFDRPVGLFFFISTLTLGAIVGLGHWWAIGGNLLLAGPFVVCTLLLPPATLHFFLIYPRPRRMFDRHPKWMVATIYAIPCLAIATILCCAAWGWILNQSLSSPEQLEQINRVLELLRRAIYASVAMAGIWFLLTLAAQIQSLKTTRNPLEHNQVKWILRAGLAAIAPLSYAIFIAATDAGGFAFGRARLPLFIASVMFTLAYAVGIVRYKLMLIDQIAGKGLLYYGASAALAIGFSIVVAMGSLVDQLFDFTVSSRQAIAITVVVGFGVLMLLWGRDSLQQTIDRRFFREKYQLDKALKRMNRAVGHLVDSEALAEMMLGSCRDALRIDRAALYLKASANGPFQLVAAQASDDIPMQFVAPEEFIETIRERGSVQRVTAGTRSEITATQNLLHELRADLVHALEVEEGIDGLVVLGPKQNSSSFTAEDLTFLNALSQITKVALHSAKVHRDMTRLNDELRLKVDKIAEQKRQIALLQAEMTRTGVVPEKPPVSDSKIPFRREAMKGNSPAIRRVLETVQKVATSESTVLVRGESGTGKELLAQVLHDNSPRVKGPMIRVHCASLSAGLLESELFGHVKGAFTGAHRDKVGRFEAANGGTLFLDEIGDISLDTQIKLLRVLQERRFEPVGSVQSQEVDVRLVTATHQDLEKLIAAGRFREDLYYRLNVISITLPSLKERREDIFELALYFLHRAAQRMNKSISHIEDDAISALEQYDWPGNIRELENAIERAIVMADGDRITRAELPTEVVQNIRRGPSHVVETKPQESRPLEGSGLSPLSDSLERARGAASGSEREILESALRECDGNKARAARLLGMPRSTYYSKLKKYGLG